MRATLHVKTEQDFDLNDFVIDTLGALTPNFDERTINTQSIPKRLRNSNDKTGKNSRGGHWTWVTKNGNAIYIWDVSKSENERVIGVEISCRRHVFSDPSNGIEILVSALEECSKVSRESWEVILFYSGLDDPWYVYTENENTAHNRNKEIKRYVPKPRIRGYANEIYDETGGINKYQIINALLSNGFEKDHIDNSASAINDIVGEIERRDIIKSYMSRYDVSAMEISDIMRELSPHFEKSDMRHVYNDVWNIVNNKNA